MSPSVNKNKLLKQCLAHELVPSQVVNLCLDSDLRLTKVIRIPYLAAALNTTDVLPTHAKIIHIVRHPADILKSQYKMGWLRVDRVPAGRERFEYYAEVLCKNMAVNEQVASEYEHTHGHVLRIRFEDFIAHKTATTAAIYQFIDEPMTDEISSRTSVILERNIMAGSSDKRIMSHDEAVSYVSMHAICSNIMSLYSYI